MADQSIIRATGLLIIEVINSNPNGDPERESDPRQRPDDKGEISPVSFKRKLRDLVEDKEGPVWQAFATKFKLATDNFGILESRKSTLKEIRNLAEKEFINKYWDGRVFGNTELEKGRKVPVKTGVVQFGLGVSVAPIRIERMTTTNPPVEGDKSVGMAPLGYRIVEHGIYCMPFFVNPSAAHKSGCTTKDIELMLALIPHAYTHSRSYVRPNVEILHAWFMEHKSSLGSCPDYKLIDAFTPKKKKDADKPSISREDYHIPSSLTDELKNKIASCKDLVES
ncbi:MAG: type I CRISPR-associated protein Cas7 [Syntrophaceae bacterium]|jgi:Cas7 group CRISPR-associated protein Csh2|nr:type I CRISPR-associated protein Cas7 [Syntrophaceae bacterium]